MTNFASSLATTKHWLRTKTCRIQPTCRTLSLCSASPSGTWVPPFAKTNARIRLTDCSLATSWVCYKANLKRSVERNE